MSTQEYVTLQTDVVKLQSRLIRAIYGRTSGASEPEAAGALAAAITQALLRKTRDLEKERFYRALAKRAERASARLVAGLEAIERAHHNATWREAFAAFEVDRSRGHVSGPRRPTLADYENEGRQWVARDRT